MSDAAAAGSRAVLVEGPGRYRLLNRPEPPEPGPGEVRVAVHAAGVCASDREIWDGTRAEGYVRYPVVPGHEWSGTVEATGPGVDPALTGRGTVGEGFRSCQSCDHCRAGRTTLCSAPYQETGFTRPGAFADHLVLPARLLHPLPDGADLTAAALLEPAAVVAAAVLAAAPVPGERIAVVGAGTLGLLAVQLLAACSPAELVTVDPRERPRRLAAGFGATRTVTPGELSGLPAGHDLVVETAGARSSAAEACALARRGGRIVLAGIPAPGADGLDPLLLTVRQLSLATVFGAPSAAWSFAVRAFATGLLDPGPLITHRLPLTGFETAVALVGSGDPAVGKVLLQP
ncbi:zinc-dependent alcohol dehydrogenase [Streptomyces aidingensis]|uniref:2-deoxy-scyllo-inosamine dehydrogenase n=1 Tax=Streptomyces aidingensis TaxID=910347 RepID=A0A1I1G199_9ACTN|nr:alcohol dehydrogenase catalytic domain-containing protein [Streptomyces aidingensis]SFC03618.1 Threonine dehydrogenase [Streptomyces aidingensis]